MLIDLIHDKADSDLKIQGPLFLIWAKNGFIGQYYNVLEIWKAWAHHVEGKAIDCGHFIAEEAPEETY